MGHSDFVPRFLLFIVLKGFSVSVSGVSFTFTNKCDYMVWPGILGGPALDTSGFELGKGESRSLQAPAGWSGRFWGRTGCNFDGSGHGSCATGDCGSGQMECNGAGAAPPATLAEFTIGSGSGTQDFYDVSLVDGFNIQMIVENSGGSGNCGSTGCAGDLNRRCPVELRVAGGGGCKSACDTFGTPEYCCKGEFDSPAACRPTAYSEVFKSACPKSYSYAYDDATSTFTCAGGDYTLTFCPSLRSQRTLNPKATNGSGSPGALVELYADLAAGDSTTIKHPSSSLSLIAFSIYFLISSFLIL